jgi:hypothetical protein
LIEIYYQNRTKAGFGITFWKHVLSDQSVHITHTYGCVSKLSKFGAYLYSCVHNNTFLSIFSFLLVDFGSFHSHVDNVINDSFNYAVTRHRWNCQELSIALLWNRVKFNRDIPFTCILRLLNNSCVKHNFKSVHVSNLFWSREYNSAKEICKYPSFSKVGGDR